MASIIMKSARCYFRSPIVIRKMLSSVTAQSGGEVDLYAKDSWTNVTPTVISRMSRNLHRVPRHPINILKERVVNHFHKRYTTRTGNALFAHFDNVGPIVTTEQNFDSLLVPKGHVSRSMKDNYYINQDHVLRSHTSAHQRDFIKMGLDCFLVTGDVYRRDEIDPSHYPVFHQMEGVRLFTRDQLFQNADDDELNIFKGDSTGLDTDANQAQHTFDAAKMVELDLKRTLEELVQDLFGRGTETRWVSCYFPFTHPSFELEVKFKGEWMEMLGSGVMRHGILEQGGANNKIGWAFGLGLDRLAMLLFDIPDIRLLWSKDSRFIDQFKDVGIDPKSNMSFIPFSKYPPCFKDISFWIGEDFNQNDFFEVVRDVGGDLIEKVELVDNFVNPNTKQESHCYRVTYRSMERNLLNEEINKLQDNIRNVASKKLLLQIR